MSEPPAASASASKSETSSLAKAQRSTAATMPRQCSASHFTSEREMRQHRDGLPSRHSRISSIRCSIGPFSFQGIAPELWPNPSPRPEIFVTHVVGLFCYVCRRAVPPSSPMRKLGDPKPANHPSPRNDVDHLLIPKLGSILRRLKSKTFNHREMLPISGHQR